MRYSEFNKKLYEFELQHYLSDIHIFCDGNLVGKVSKKCRYSLSTIYEVFEDLPEKVAFMLYENMMMLAETPLAKHGISHRLIAPHVMQIHWLVDGSSQPIVEYDVKHNFTRFIGRFRQMTGKDKAELKSVLERLKMVNVN